MTRTAVQDPPTTDSGAERRRRRLPVGRLLRRVPLRFVVFAVLAVAVAGVLAWLLSWWSPVPIRDVSVKGAEPEKTAEILAAAGIETGTPIRELDVEGITERVAALPGIESAQLVLSRPWTIVVDVVERFPFAVIEPAATPGQQAPAAGGRWVVIDAAGVPIREAGQKPQRLPVVEPADQPGPALTALAALAPEIRDQVRKATVDEAGAVTLMLKSGTTVQWGRPGEDDAKAQAVAVLLQYQPQGINVSVPSRPALKGDLTLPKKNQPQPDETLTQ